MSKLDPSSSPLAFFAAELTRLRGRARLSQAALAEKIRYSTSMVAMVETAKRLPSRDFAERCDVVLDGDGVLARLWPLVERSTILPWFRDLVEVEARAAQIRSYNSYSVPGLLQTEPYARATVAAHRPVLRPEEVEEAIAVRLTRQQVLERDDVALWAILEESALRRPAGDPELMRAQYEHLLRMSEQPNVVIQVIPEIEGFTCAFGRTFTIITPTPGAGILTGGNHLVYLEDIGSSQYVRDRDEVGRFVLVFDHLRGNALGDDKSAALLARLVEETQKETR